MNANSSFLIEGKTVGFNSPVYFIADIAANHDGDLDRAKDLIYLAAESGADAAKFQHFNADSIVSKIGFNSLKSIKSHQSDWKKSVYEVYKDASINLSWSKDLKETCKKAGITFLTSPYSIDLVDHIDDYVPAYKIGSGDITWLEIIEHIASKGKPCFIASGASTLEDVQRAINVALPINKNICLMQCNTNYTASLENFKHIQLNVLKIYKAMYPNMVLGLSDHTPGHATVLGAVALGAKVIEKHFTDDVYRSGPDHKFSMNSKTWREMRDRCQELEFALGEADKKIEENELQTVILQRRSIRLGKNIAAGTVLGRSDIKVLRPCPNDGLPPYLIENVIGMTLRKDMNEGDCIKWIDLE